MNKRTKTVKKPTVEQLALNVEWLLHKILTLTERINRDGKIREEELALAHRDIEMFMSGFKPQVSYKPNTTKR